jgi:hypothetical protein
VHRLCMLTDASRFMHAHLAMDMIWIKPAFQSSDRRLSRRTDER